MSPIQQRHNCAIQMQDTKFNVAERRKGFEEAGVVDPLSLP